MTAAITSRPLLKAGRPTKYRAEFCARAYRLCLLGLTDKELAECFGVNEETLITWKAKYPKFAKSISSGKIDADAEVAEKTFHRAKGYSHKAVKIFMPAGAKKPVYAPFVEHYPPDTQAASLWLRNRQPKLWRDKQELEHSGAVAIDDPATRERRAAIVAAFVAMIEDRARRGLPQLFDETDLIDVTPKKETKP